MGKKIFTILQSKFFSILTFAEKGRYLLKKADISNLQNLTWCHVAIQVEAFTVHN